MENKKFNTSKISPTKIVMESLSNIWEFKKSLGLALVFPFTLLLLMDLCSQTFVKNPSLGSLLFLPFILLINLIATTFFSVTIYRIILRGPGAVPKVGLYKWSKQETQYLKSFLTVFAIAFLSVSPILLAEAVFKEYNISIWGLKVHYLFYIPALYLIARVSLVLPAAAVGHTSILGAAMMLTKNNGWRIAVIHIIYSAFNWLVLSLKGFIFSGSESMLSNLLNTPIYYSLLLIDFVFIAKVYEFLILENPSIMKYLTKDM